MATKEYNPKMKRSTVIVLGVFLGIISILLAYLLYALWPYAKPDANGDIPDSILSIFGYSTKISAEVRLVLLVMLVGLIGSFIHTINSFVNFYGNQKLYRSWIWYYTIRPFVGAFLALVFYLLLRGGLLAAGTNAQDINQYGILAISALAGMFSKQAMDKLLDLFQNLFKTGQPDKLADKLTNAIPKITNLEPNQVKKQTTIPIKI